MAGDVEATGRDRPKVIGLAGGVGAGKSTVARALERLGAVVIDSDAEARAALDRPEVRDRLVQWWGDGILDQSGAVDRRAVAKIVFNDPEQRKRLEDLVHPLVRRSREQVVERAQRAGAEAVVIDAPLLFEAGLDAECDAVVYVEAPRDQRLERLRASRGWDEAELDRRENSQTPLATKRRLSDYAVENVGDPSDLDRRIGEMYREILSREGRRGLQ